jgi:peptidoglycan/LPS O-acetylase OafA/YrhL
MSLIPALRAHVPAFKVPGGQNLFFCVAVFSAGWPRVVALAALALVMGPKIPLLLPVWLLGVWACRATQGRTLSVRIGALLAAASLLGYVAFRRLTDGPRHLDDITNRWLGSDAVAVLGYSKWFLSSYLIGTLVALHLMGIAAISQWLARQLPGRAIRYLASFTFALYLFHYPLLHVYAAWLEHAGLSGYRGALVIPATLLTVWLLGQLTERRKATVRRWLTVGAERLLSVGRRWALAVGEVRR